MNPNPKYAIATVEHALANPLEYSLSRNIGGNICRILRRNCMGYLNVSDTDFFAICRAVEKALEELNTWTLLDAAYADKEGWALCLAPADDGTYIYSSNRGRFQTGTEANFHVFKKAQAGDKLALKALRILGLSL